MVRTIAFMKDTFLQRKKGIRPIVLVKEYRFISRIESNFAIGISRLLVKPDGSKRVWLNLSTSVFSGTPYWRASEVMVAMVSIRPETVLPSLAMRRKISPGWPSSYWPTVR